RRAGGSGASKADAAGGRPSAGGHRSLAGERRQFVGRSGIIAHLVRRLRHPYPIEGCHDAVVGAGAYAGCRPSGRISKGVPAMYVIAGVTGHTGRGVAETLLAQRENLRVIVRNAQQGETWKQRGAEVAVAQLGDATAVAKALGGAKGAYLLVPPRYDTDD